MSSARGPVRGGLIAALLACVWASGACQGTSVGGADLPGEPIAIIYYPEEIARRRAEDLEATEGRKRKSLSEGKEGVMHVNLGLQYLDDTFGVQSQGEFDPMAGYLALLDPRTAQVKIIEAARRGAIPQDWSSDHRHLLFSQRTSQNMQLFEYDTEQDHVVRLTREPGIHPWGCYGPDHRLVLMSAEFLSGSSSNQTLSTKILLTEPGGLDPQPISAGPMDHSPTCAPDGSAVAYVRTGTHGGFELVVHSPLIEGSSRTIAPGAEPRFTADSQWIIYTSQRRGHSTLWRIRPNGSGRSRIGSGTGFDEMRPASSPSGRFVVYQSEANSRSRLFVRRFDGTGDRILFADGDASNPVW